MKSVTSMTQEDISRANQAAFDEAAPVHGKYYFDELLAGFRTKGFSCLRGIRKRMLLEHGIAGKAIAQFCCNNGRELLSLKNLGAGRCVGFDIADDFLAHGKAFAEAGGIECTFECCDVYRIPESYNDRFDIVLVTPGALCYMVKLGGFFEAASRLLKPDGWFFLHEMHPLVEVYFRGLSARARRPLRSYFDPGPFETTDGLDYYKRKRRRSKPCYFMHHTMSDIIQACIDCGLALETFEEQPQDVSGVFSGGLFRRFQRRVQAIPLSYVLTAGRRAV